MTDSSETDFTPVLAVASQDNWKIIRQERTPGDLQMIYLDPDEARAIGWALLADDQATADLAAPVVQNTPDEFISGGQTWDTSQA